MSFLSSLVDLWVKQAEHSAKAKEEQFGKTAAKVWGFLGKTYKQLYSADGEDSEERPFMVQGFQKYRPRINKTRQYINVYLPFLLSALPHRLVSPRRPPLPAAMQEWLVQQYGEAALQQRQQIDFSDQFQSYLMQWFLNYLPVEEYDFFRQARTCLPEALAKGRGVVWHELQAVSNGVVPISEYDTVDDLYLDPDHKRWLDLNYIIRWRHRPAWWLAERFQLPVEKIRGARKSHAQLAAEYANKLPKGVGEDHNDIVDYFEVTSRMGIGHKLLSAAEEIQDQKEVLDSLPHAWLAILPGLEHPLNLDPDKFVGPDAETLIRGALEWPIAFHQNNEDPWPCTVLDFYPNADDPWATSSLEAAMPFQAFLDHAYAFLMGKARVTSRQVVLLAKSLSEDIKKLVLEGGDFEVGFFEGAVEELEKKIHTVQFDEPKQFLFTLIALAERAFERMTDMDPLLQGQAPGPQMRSAEEAALRGAHINTRPEEFRDITNKWMSTIACKEGIATRLHVGPPVVAPIFGEELGEAAGPDGLPPMGPLTTQWAVLINTDDPAKAAAELSYKVEHGSAQRKNKAFRDQLAQTLSQNLLAPMLQIAMQTGLTRPYNALLRMIAGDDVDLKELELPDQFAQVVQALQQQQTSAQVEGAPEQ